jgi:uncharacterized membrane protein YuzA (DUF378 family)
MEEDIRWRAPIDFCTLVLILIAGFQLGLLGFFELDLMQWALGSWQSTIYMVIGLSAVWQLWRQRFLG